MHAVQCGPDNLPRHPPPPKQRDHGLAGAKAVEPTFVKRTNIVMPRLQKCAGRPAGNAHHGKASTTGNSTSRGAQHSLIVMEVSGARMQHEVGAVGGQRRGLGVQVRDLECHLIVHAKVAVVALLGGLALKGRRGHNDVLRGQGRQVGC